jgi:hypothetical protein
MKCLIEQKPTIGQSTSRLKMMPEGGIVTPVCRPIKRARMMPTATANGINEKAK